LSSITGEGVDKLVRVLSDYAELLELKAVGDKPPGAGAGTRPERPSTGQVGAGQRPAQRPEGAGDRQGQRQEAAGDRQQDHQDQRDQAREDWQSHADQAREDRQDWAEDEYWDDHWHGHYDDDFAAGVVVGATVGTAAAVAAQPTYVTVLPCTPTMVSVNDVTYYQCGTSWYSRGYVGGSVTYIVVDQPPKY
jgi:hypothetical protein